MILEDGYRKKIFIQHRRAVDNQRSQLLNSVQRNPVLADESLVYIGIGRDLIDFAEEAEFPQKCIAVDTDPSLSILSVGRL